MARLWTAGAELQTVTPGFEFTAIVTNAPALETSIKRSGNAAWRISNNTGAEGFRQLITAAQGDYYFRFYVYVVALPTNSSRILGGFRITGAYKAVVKLTSGGLLQCFNQEDGTQIGSNSSAISLDTWYRIEIRCDSTTLASTAIEARAYVDTPGASAFWNPSGTADLAAFPTNVACATEATDNTLDFIVDDLAVNDTSGSFQNSWPGEEKVIVLRPNGNGDNSAWTGSDGNSTDNYLLVDDVPPNSTDYVQSNTSGQIDDYNLEATPSELATGDTINVVHVGVYAAVDNVTGSDPDIVLRIKASAAGTVEESASLDVNAVTYHGPAPLPANDNYQLTLYDLPGASTTAWTKADLDTAQAGIRESVTDTHFARVGALWVMVGFTPASGTDYTQSVDGGLSFAGAIFRVTSKSPAGTVTSSGAVNKASTKSFTGGITPSGGLIKQTSKILSGALNSIVGTLEAARLFFLSLSGSITPTGTSSKETNKSLAGTVSSAGDISKQDSKTLSGTVTSSGGLTKQSNKDFSGSLASGGSLTKQINKILSGTLESSGNIAKQAGKVFSGTLELSGNLLKQTNKILSGILTSAGDLATQLISGGQTYFKDLSGTLNFSGTVEKITSKLFSGTLNSSGAVSKSTGKQLSGTVTPSGELTKASLFSKVLSGTLSLAGSLTKQTGKMVSGSQSFLGSLTKQTSKLVSGTQSFLGTLSKLTSKQFSGTLTSSGTVTTSNVIVKMLEGAMSFTGSLQKTTNKSVSGVLNSAGVIQKHISKSLESTLSMSGTISKAISKFFSGVINFVGNLISVLVPQGTSDGYKIFLLGSLDRIDSLEGQTELAKLLSGSTETPDLESITSSDVFLQGGKVHTVRLQGKFN